MSFDSLVGACYINKLNKYIPSCQRIMSELDLAYKIGVLIGRSWGSAHSVCVGVPVPPSKSVTGHCFVSAVGALLDRTRSGSIDTEIASKQLSLWAQCLPKSIGAGCVPCYFFPSADIIL